MNRELVEGWTCLGRANVFIWHYCRWSSNPCLAFSLDVHKEHTFFSSSSVLANSFTHVYTTPSSVIRTRFLAAESPGRRLKRQTPGPHPSPAQSIGWSPRICMFKTRTLVIPVQGIKIPGCRRQCWLRP